jgi:hypothetical protein
VLCYQDFSRKASKDATMKAKDSSNTKNVFCFNQQMKPRFKSINSAENGPT